MKTSMRQHTGVVRFASLGASFLVLAGVVGMHGLSAHGLGNHGLGNHGLSTHAAVNPGLQATASAEDHTRLDSAHLVTLTLWEADPAADGAMVMSTAALGPRRGDLTGGWLAELCLAVLLLGITLSLLALALRIRGRGLPLNLPCLRVPDRARDRDPPRLTKLCIRRC